MNSAPWDLAEWLRGLDFISKTDRALAQHAADQLAALARIHAEMDGREWDAETKFSIAEDLRGIGLEVRDIDSCDCDDRSWYGEEHDSACPLAGLARIEQ